MTYSSLPTVSPGGVIQSSTWGNIAKANEDYLFSGRPGQFIKRDNNATYTTTSTTFVNIDGTNLTITQTISSGKALIGFTGSFDSSGTPKVQLDITVDGTRIGSGGNDGLLTCSTTGLSGGNGQCATLCQLVTGLSVGSHTFVIQWKASVAGTVYLLSGNGSTTPQDQIPTFWVEEIG